MDERRGSQFEEPLVIESMGGGAESAEEAASRRSRERLLLLFRGRLKLLFSMAIPLALIGMIAGFFATGLVYRATAQINVSPAGDKVIFARTPESEAAGRGFMDVQFQIIQSSSVIQAALATNHWQESGDPTMRWEDFLGHLYVRRGSGDTRIMQIQFEHKDAPVAAAGVRAVLAAYTDHFMREQDGGRSEQIRKLEELTVRLRGDLEHLQRRRAAILGDMDEEALNRRHDSAVAELVQLGVQVSALRTEISGNNEAGAAQQYQGMDEQELAQRFPALRELHDQRNQILRSMEMKRQAGLGESHHSLKGDQAALRIVQEQIDQLVEDARAGRVLPLQGSAGPGGGASMSPEQMEARLRLYESLYEQAKVLVQELGQIRANLEQVDTEIASVRANLQRSRDRIDSWLIESDIVPGRIVPISPVTVPSKPSNGRRRIQLAMAGGGMGAMTAVGIVLLIGLADRRFRHIADATVELPDVPVLGSLPALAADLKNVSQAQMAAQALHRIRAMIQLSVGARRREPHEGGGRVVTVTSAMPGAGKSSLTAALGLSFAASGERTLMIDLDMVGAGLSRRMGMVVRKPLSELLVEHGLVEQAWVEKAEERARQTNESLEDIVVREGVASRADVDRLIFSQEETSAGLIEACYRGTLDGLVTSASVDRLQVLLVGEARAEDSGVLSHAALHKLLEECRSRYDMVLIDTGPILGSVEATMGVVAADTTVLVVSRGEDRRLADKAIDQIRAMGGRIAGLVFNQALDEDFLSSSHASCVSDAQVLASRPLRPMDDTFTRRWGPIGCAVASSGMIGTHGGSPASPRIAS